MNWGVQQFFVLGPRSRLNTNPPPTTTTGTREGGRCYVRALEAVGLARKGEGGRWVERAHAATQAEGYEPSVQHRGEEEKRREEKRMEERRRGEEKRRGEEHASDASDVSLARHWLTTP